MDAELRVVSEKLQHRFGVDGPVVDATVDQEARRLSDVRVHTFVPLLVERAARHSLAQRYPFYR
jgi:hypothetical protein